MTLCYMPVILTRKRGDRFDPDCGSNGNKVEARTSRSEDRGGHRTGNRKTSPGIRAGGSELGAAGCY